MRIQTVVPCPALQAIVQHYLLIEIPGVNRHTFAPTGFPMLIFQLQQRALHVHTSLGLVPLPEVVLVGPQTKSLTGSHPEKGAAFVIVFREAGLYRWLGKSVEAYTDRLVAADQLIFSKSLSRLRESLVEAASPDESIRGVETFLLETRLPLLPRTDDLDAAVRLMKQYNGMLTIQEVAERLGMARRSLERKFAERIGLTPKQYAQILRFHFMLHYLQQNPLCSWIDLTHAAGFYDQSHLIKHFHGITGQSPNAFRSPAPFLEPLPVTGLSEK